MPLLWGGMKGRKTVNCPSASSQAFFGGQRQLSVCGRGAAGADLPAALGVSEPEPGALAAAGPERALGPGSAAVAPRGAGPLRASSGCAGTGAAGPGPRSEPRPGPGATRGCRGSGRGAAAPRAARGPRAAGSPGPAPPRRARQEGRGLWSDGGSSEQAGAELPFHRSRH